MGLPEAGKKCGGCVGGGREAPHVNGEERGCAHMSNNTVHFLGAWLWLWFALKFGTDYGQDQNT